jgi:Ni/Co efflux regulator RcnB
MENNQSQAGPPPDVRRRIQNSEGGPPPGVRRRLENNQNQAGSPPDWRRRIQNSEGGPPPNVRRRLENNQNQAGPPPDWRRRVQNAQGNQQGGPPPDSVRRRQGGDPGQAGPGEWRRRMQNAQSGSNRPPDVRRRIENAQGGRPNLRRGDGDRIRERRGPSQHYAQLRPRQHRYRDWNSVPRGRYFDRGYASVVGGFYNRHYRWWGEPGWRVPYRSWRIGYYLPRHVRYNPIPWALYHRLPPPPFGCRYVRYGNDILLIAISSLLVIDALVLIDHYDGYDDGYYDYYCDDYYGDCYYDDYYYDDY